MPELTDAGQLIALLLEAEVIWEQRNQMLTEDKRADLLRCIIAVLKREQFKSFDVLAAWDKGANG